MNKSDNIVYFYMGYEFQLNKIELFTFQLIKIMVEVRICDGLHYMICQMSLF